MKKYYGVKASTYALFACAIILGITLNMLKDDFFYSLQIPNDTPDMLFRYFLSYYLIFGGFLGFTVSLMYQREKNNKGIEISVLKQLLFDLALILSPILICIVLFAAIVL